MFQKCECGCRKYARPGNRFINGHNNRVMSKEIRKRISLAIKEHARKLRKRGIIPVGFKGPHTEEAKARSRAALIERMKDPTKHHFWKGGISSDKQYGRDYRKVRDGVKERDFYTCRNPKCKGVSTRIVAHHIDYNKRNCIPKNMITLCHACNIWANINRSFWKLYYTCIMEGRRRLPVWI